MNDDLTGIGIDDIEGRDPEVKYNKDKDFYKGVGGELRMKAEGLFKKAKEKGISIEEIEINTLNENKAEFPGIGSIYLPSFIVKVKGMQLSSGQRIIDAKQIDYFNRYQKYIADKIERKNAMTDEKGKIVRDAGKIKQKETIELFLTEWEKFEIAKNLLEDKEFGLEKTITGACDRVIRKLMGENDWMYPDEARMLLEEFNTVQNKSNAKEQDRNRHLAGSVKKATDRQLNYLKIKVKNLGLDINDQSVIREILKQSGFEDIDIKELSTNDLSKIIDSIGDIVIKVKGNLSNLNNVPLYNEGAFINNDGGMKQ
jgi:hypothetical protein